MNHAQRIRAAVKRAQRCCVLLVNANAHNYDGSLQPMLDGFNAALSELEAIARELEQQPYTRESNYEERARTEGELHAEAESNEKMHSEWTE